eukprot:3922457-Rhodomonas_salina.3
MPGIPGIPMPGMPGIMPGMPMPGMPMPGAPMDGAIIPPICVICWLAGNGFAGVNCQRQSSVSGRADSGG